MDALRRKTYTHLSKAVAVLLCAVLLQTLGAALVHVALVEHIWCENHQVFEHASTTDAAVHDDGRAHMIDLEKHPPKGDHDPGDKECHALCWLHGPAVPVPDLNPTLINLPPPAELPAARPLSEQAHISSPIDLLRLAPGHSPPARTA